MSLGVPGKVLDIQDDELRTARVDFGSEVQNVSLALLSDAKVGDYVVVQAGAAIQALSESQAVQVLAAMKELEDLDKGKSNS